MLTIVTPPGKSPREHPKPSSRHAQKGGKGFMFSRGGNNLGKYPNQNNGGRTARIRIRVRCVVGTE